MWNKISEFFQLVGINLYVSIKGLAEYTKVVWRYYGNKEFRRADLALLKAYRFDSPYQVHKRYMQELNKEDVYLYGETYLTTLDTLAQKADIGPEDVYIELGCGRGRTAFWMRCIKHCYVVGIDYVPQFITRANRVILANQLEKIAFYCEDFLTAPWHPGTVYYLDATLLEGEEVAAVIKRCDELPTGTKMIAINFSLVGDFPSERPQWHMIEIFTAPFPWGESEVGLFRKN